MAQLRATRGGEIRAALGYVTTFNVGAIEGVGATNYVHYYYGARRRAEELGYHLDVLWRLEPKMTTGKFDRILNTRGIRGIIVAPRPNPIGHLSLDWSRVTAAALGHPLPRPHIHHACAGHYHLIHTALRVIQKYGYQRIGLAIFPEFDRDSHLAVSSRFAQHLAQVAPKSRVPPLCRFGATLEPSPADFKRWFDKNRPEVIMSAGLVVLGWMREMGIEVPGNCAYVDLTMPVPLPGIAGMCERTQEIGACAVDLVVEQIHNNRLGVPDIAKSVVVEGVWCDGATLPKRSGVA